MKSTQPEQTPSNAPKAAKQVYETPTVIYEGTITTRAGTPLGGGDENVVDPADLFGR
jgi:hypothetical protein